MRSSLRLSILALAACASLAPEADATDYFDVTDESELVGTWIAKRDGQECAISFADGYTFKGRLVTKEGVETPFEGTWSLSRSTLVNGFISMDLHYVYSKFGQLPAGAKDRDVIIDRNTDPKTGLLTLTFRSSNGERRAYTKSDPSAPTPAKK